MTRPVLFQCITRVILGLLLSSCLFGRVLDDFNSPTRSGWEDFTFIDGFGVPVQANGQFRFEQPPANQQIFSAAWKSSEVLELAEGRTLELRVDVVEAGAKDSFAVLGFIPNTSGNTPLSLTGYGFAKSTTDILITKSLNRYFYADDPADPIKNENVTLSLSLRVKDGNVEITARVLDKDDGNRVIFEHKVIDTPAADVMADGTDDPPAPFLTTGHFTLMCFQDFDANAPENPYKVYFDNAEYFVTEEIVVDDFSDSTRPDWVDWTFQAGFGLPVVAQDQLRFELPPAGTQIFSATWYEGRLFELLEGELLEFSVDIAETGEKDSFAVLGFIPNTGGNTPLTLGGYGFAKSTTDILITKGLNRYFVNEGWPTEGLNENIRMVLSILIRNGNAEVTAQILDLSDNLNVVWEKTVIDTPEADVMAEGTDEPPGPFLTTGYFTLMCFQDFDAAAPENPYKVYYQNARAWASPAADNLPPNIGNVVPRSTSPFLPATTGVSFDVTDDQPIPDSGLVLVLNGERFTSETGLVLSGEGSARTVRFEGLIPNNNYIAQLIAVDSDGVGVTNFLYFDTFTSQALVLESEDYNYSSGLFIDNPTVTPEGVFHFESYHFQFGISDVDYFDTRTSPDFATTPYRPNDNVRMRRSLDLRRTKHDAAGGGNNVNGVYDYDLGDIASGEWLNYTRTVPPGTYEVYLRQSIFNMQTADSRLELVSGDRTVPNQTTQVLGTFLGQRSGFEYRNTPLTDGSGLNKTVLNLSGVTTFRLHQVTANTSEGQRYQNYLVLVPVPEPGIQRAVVTTLIPANGAAVSTVSPEIETTIQNRETSVVVDSVRLELNGVETPARAIATADGAQLSYVLPILPPSGQPNAAVLTYQDNEGETLTVEWSFEINYRTLNPAHRLAGTGNEGGFTVRVVQAPPDSPLLENSLQRAESQLAANSTIAREYEVVEVASVINYSQEAFHGGTDGFFDNDSPIPGQSEALGTENYAMEVFTYLDLPEGHLRFGVLSDDGFKISTGINPDANTSPLAFHNGGPANQTFDVVVPAAGIYAFRLIWYERSGGAHVEWFTVDVESGERSLVNTVGSVQAYVNLSLPDWQLHSASVLAGPFTPESSAVFDSTLGRITVPRTGSTRYYRVAGPSAAIMTQIEVLAEQVVIHFELD